jgi:hypothetical protein
MPATTTTANSNAPRASKPDAFYPSGKFARVPLEALSPLAWAGTRQMSHAEFRVLVALCYFRGMFKDVYPSQETLADMTGIARNNVSRAAQSLQDRGWLRIDYVNGDPRQGVEHYELSVPARDEGPTPTMRRPKPSHPKRTGHGADDF